LTAAGFLEGATMPNGQKYKDWLTRHSSFPDTDTAGMPDKWEQKLGRNPNNPDTDGDSVQDGEDPVNAADATNSEGATNGRASSHHGA